MTLTPRRFKKQVISYFAKIMTKKPSYVKKHLKFDCIYYHGYDLLFARIWFKLEDKYEMRIDYNSTSTITWRIYYSEHTPFANKGSIASGATIEEAMKTIWDNSIVWLFDEEV